MSLIPVSNSTKISFENIVETNYSVGEIKNITSNSSGNEKTYWHDVAVTKTGQSGCCGNYTVQCSGGGCCVSIWIADK